MDQRHTYEQTITGKLDALPIPDMADAIWSRVEAQLDIDMPEDDGPSGTNGPTPSTPVIIGGSLVLIIAFFALFFLSQKNDDQPVNENSTSPSPPAELQIGPPENNNSAGDPGPLRRQDQLVLPPTSPFVVPDSFASAPMINPADSSRIFPNTVVTSPPVTIPKGTDSTTIPGKKKRGVSGINDNDYKIVPKKDSTP